GQLRTISVKDELSGISAMFNAETDNVSNQGLAIYGLIDGGTEVTFDDGAGFEISVPSGAVDQSQSAFLYLSRPNLALVVRLTSELEALPVGYKLHIEGSPLISNLPYRLSFPIPEGVSLNNPQIGRWDPILLNWTQMGVN
ncbi:MAG: hypothetical protein P9M15_06980, partial [Candidatus Electryoneaceae bacterium]|nr:hypothetical protein [Candidatus Electryoneaceae bacterium]